VARREYRRNPEVILYQYNHHYPIASPNITAKPARQTCPPDAPPTPPTHQPYTSKNPWLMAAASVPWLHYC
jgi:hypothetical protein